MSNKYFLIANLGKKNYSEYRGSARSISEKIPHTVEELWVGIKKQPKKTRKITTFRDENGNIIEKAFDYSDNKLRHRLYKRRTININENETVNSVTIHDYNINKRVLPYYEDMLYEYEELNPIKTMLWNLKEVITNHVSTNKQTGEKILSQVKIENLETPTKQKHSFIEFPPVINNKFQSGKKKILSFLVNGLTNKIIKGTEISKNTKMPQHDSYLPYRALTINDSKEPLTRRYIKERKLENALIEINPDYYPQNEDDKLYAADFNPVNGSINFNREFKPASKTRVAGIAKHETEHAWQYFLRSRVTLPVTEWEEFISENFGRIRLKNLLKEAKRYTKSIKSYISLTKELEDAGKVQEYRDNYIEIKASKAGAKTRKEYDKQGKVIRNNFKHIPKEYL